MQRSWLSLLICLSLGCAYTDVLAQGSVQVTPDSLFSLARKAAFVEKNYPKAISLSKEVLSQIPTYSEVQIFLARVYFWNRQVDQALNEVRKLEAAYPQNEEIEVLRNNIKAQNVKNRIWLTYDFVSFDKGYNDALHKSPWHLVSAQYMRFTGWGPILAKVNYAHRFAKNGGQIEVEAYPRISKNVYSYVEMGISPNFPVFPKFRSGGSLYGILPKQFEVEGGIRYLQFDSPNVIYVLGLSKYQGNFFFNTRSFFAQNGTNSYNFTGRYYLGNADEFFGLTIGTGVSPDESQRNILIDNDTKLKAYRLIVEYRRIVQGKNIVGMLLSGFQEQLSPQKNGRQFNIGLLYQRIF
jgi:YaiO family outer membrane protein